MSSQPTEVLLSYIQAPEALPVATALLVALVRKHWPAVDGLRATVICAAVCGAALAALQAAAPTIVAWLSAHPAIGLPVSGAAAAVLAMSGASLWQWISSQVQPLNIDARTIVSKEPGP